MMKRTPKIALALILCTLAMVSSDFLSACAVSTENAGEDTASVQPHTDTEALKELFPALRETDGITRALWETEALGDKDSRLSVPGPTDYHRRGFIFVEADVVEEWMRTYAFEEVTIDLTSSCWNASDYEDVTWYYTQAFDDAYKPGYYRGHFYVSEYGIFFDITTT